MPKKQIDAIKPIYLEREFEASEQKNSNVLSYRRSMSVRHSPANCTDKRSDLKMLGHFGNGNEHLLTYVAVPRRIKSGRDAQTLTDVGDKVAQRVNSYYLVSHIETHYRIRLTNILPTGQSRNLTVSSLRHDTRY